ncbi:TPA: hypothetical protein I7783_20855 [Vibrio vulnificus]|nr:hypothetical protein [Vibrio vulnificus]MCU8330851.1 hypothetical protein [Vibrio vulnificus]HAS8600424.1 hypothetical protein [Vibrio vulnificus]
MAKNSRELNQNLNDLARKALDGDLVARDLLLQSLKSTKSVRRFIAQFEEENSGWSVLPIIRLHVQASIIKVQLLLFRGKPVRGLGRRQNEVGVFGSR